MTKIKLYGVLGKKFGREFNLKVQSPAEAIRALSAQVRGFRKFLNDSEKNGICFRVFTHNSEITSAAALKLNSHGEIRIVPVVAGANGELRFLVGAALIAASIYGGPAGAALFSETASSYMFATGASLAIGGAVEVLTRGMISTAQPPERPENTPSYSFAGAVNTTSQGHPVPLGYGRMLVGGAVISASIAIENLLAGYEYELQEVYKDIWSYGTEDTFYSVKPPTNYTRRELLEYIEGHSEAIGGIGSGQGTQYVPPKWHYRYFYMDSVLVLREI